MHQPLVSVIMPVYNAEHDLREAIDSILTQTYTNIELLIINDASTDRSLDIIKSYSDKRIKLVNNQQNLRQPKTRNKALALAKGKYIANMDSDDISLPERISKQVNFMELHPEIDICGGYIKCFGGTKERIVELPVDNKEIAKASVLKCPMCHPTVMFRHSSIEKYGIRYDENYMYAQDFELWSRLVSQGVSFYNLPEVVLNYREGENGIGRVHASEQRRLANKIVNRNIRVMFNADRDFQSIIDEKCGLETIIKDYSYLSRIRCNLPENSLFNKIELDWIIIDFIKHIADMRSYYGICVFGSAFNILKINDASTKWWLKLFIKCVIHWKSGVC